MTEQNQNKLDFSKIREIPIRNLKLWPNYKKSRSRSDIMKIKDQLKDAKIGMINPLSVIKYKKEFYVVEGKTRYLAAKELYDEATRINDKRNLEDRISVPFETIKCNVAEIEDENEQIEELVKILQVAANETVKKSPEDAAYTIRELKDKNGYTIKNCSMITGYTEEHTSLLYNLAIPQPAYRAYFCGYDLYFVNDSYRDDIIHYAETFEELEELTNDKTSIQRTTGFNNKEIEKPSFTIIGPILKQFYSKAILDNNGQLKNSSALNDFNNLIAVLINNNITKKSQVQKKIEDLNKKYNIETDENKIKESEADEAAVNMESDKKAKKISKELEKIFTSAFFDPNSIDNINQLLENSKIEFKIVPISK